MEHTDILYILWEGIKSYLRVTPDIYFAVAILGLGLIFTALALYSSSSTGRRTRSSASLWMILAGVFVVLPSVLAFFRYWKEISDIKTAMRLTGSRMLFLEPHLRLEIIAPLAIASVFLLLNGILFLIALAQYFKLPKQLQAGGSIPAQARLEGRMPFTFSLLAFLTILVASGTFIGIQVFQARRFLITPAQSSSESRPPGPVEVPREGMDNSAENGIEGGVEGGITGEIPGGVPGGLAGENDLEAPVRVTSDPPQCLKHVPPIYPEIARIARVEGVVILEAKVDKEGKVEEARVLRSIPLLDQAAIDAVKQWVYQPYVVNGEPKSVLLTVTLSFSLEDK